MGGAGEGDAMAGTSAEVEAAEQQQTSPAGTRSSAPRSKSKRSPKGGGGVGSTVISSSNKRRGSKGSGSSSGGKKRGEDRPSTPSMRVYDEAGCSNSAVVASRPTRPMTSTLTDKFAELDEEYSDGDDDDEGERRQQHGAEQTTIQVRPLPKIRLDLMPSPREEDEYRRASPRSGSGKKKKKSGGSGSGSGSGGGKRRSSGRSSRRSSEAASDDGGADGDAIGVGDATRNAGGGTPVLNESMTSSTGAVMDHGTTVGQKVGRVKAAARALEAVAAAERGRRGTVSAGAVNASRDRDRGGAVAKAGARNTNVGGAAAAGGGGGGEEGDELDADGFPLRPTRLFHDNTSTGTTGCGDDVVMDGFGNAFYDDSNDDGAGARPSDDGAQFPSSPSPLLAIQQNSGGGDSARGGRARRGHHHRLVSDVAVASAESASVSASASASSERSPTAAKDSRKDAHDVSPGYVQVTKTKIERDEFAALSDEQCDDEEDEDEDEDADTTPVAAPDADSTDKVFRSIKEYAREKADAVSIEDDDDDDDDHDDHDENARGVSPKRSPRGKVPERSPTKSSRRTEKDDYASPRSPEHRQDDRRRRSGKAHREKEERTAHTDSSFSPFDWLLMICGDVSSIVSEGMGGHDDEDRTHDGTSTTAADEYHEDEQGGSTRSRKEYGIDKFKW